MTPLALLQHLRLLSPRWNDSPPAGTVTVTEIDPETGKPVNYEVANDEIIIEFSSLVTKENIDQFFN